MLHNVRKHERYPLWGSATLSAGGRVIHGQVANISASGIAIRIDDDHEGLPGSRKTWLCRVDSPDLPDTLEFLVKVVRKAVWLHGYGVGCTITVINERDAALLKAYRALAMARTKPPSTDIAHFVPTQKGLSSVPDFPLPMPAADKERV